MLHFSGAWERRTEPNIVLVHYDDLVSDLEGEMRRIATRLDITIPEAMWPDLVRAATFRQMRAHSDRLAPDALGVLKDPVKFFRRGSSGEGRELLSVADLDRYQARVSELAPVDLLQWLHRDVL
jgi:hypothetical protein